MSTSREVQMEAAACCLCNVDDSVLVTEGRDFEHDTVSAPLRIVRCAKCGVYYLNPRPTADSLDLIYPENYMSHEFSRKANPLTKWAKNWVYRRRCKRLRRHVTRNENCHVFEIGCGEGVFLRTLKATIGHPHWQLSGCELKSDVTSRIEQTGVEVITGPFEDLELPDNAYDLVLMLHVIEHVSNPLEVLRKAWRVTRPGGHVVVETPNSNSIDARVFRSKYWFDYQFPRHFYIFNTHNLVQAVESAGFQVVDVVRQVGPMVWTNSIRNWIQDHPRTRFALPLFSRWNPIALSAFTTVDTIVKQFRDTSRFQVIARKPEDTAPAQVKVADASRASAVC